MTISRRKMLELGALSLPMAAAVNVGAAPRPRSQAGRGGVVFAIEGLGVIILAGKPGGKPHAAALVITNPQGIQMAGHEFPKHYATLGIDRASIDVSSTAEPVATTAHRVFYSLASTDMTYEYVPTAGETVAGFEASVGDEIGSGCQPTEENWKSTEWIMKIDRDIQPGATLWARWNESKYIDSVVMFKTGALESKKLTADDPGSEPGTSRVWKWDDGRTRRFKEMVRHLIDAPGTLHITLTPRTGGEPKKIIVEAKAGDRQIVTITQLPRPGGHGTVIHDVISYLSLTEKGMSTCPDLKCLPAPQAKSDCGSVGDSVKCGCCPTAVIYDPNWLP